MNILFVCSGNTCRSPMAEGYLKSLKLPDLNVRSAGIFVGPFQLVNENSVAAMSEVGVDISSHCPTQISLSLINSADKIICMAHSHLSAIKSVAENKEIVVLSGGIFDPYGGDITVYRRCRNEIISAIDKMFSVPEIKPAQSRHIEKIAQLEKVCFSSPWSENAISQAIENGTEFFVAEQNGEFAGYFAINCVLDEGYIANIAVKPEFRRCGIGKKMLKKLDSLAMEKGLSFITLEVRQSNLAAISLYSSNGYKPEGNRKNFYEDPRENAVIMTKRF